MYSRKTPTSAEALKEYWMLAQLLQCSNPLLTCLTETSGSTDADFWRAIMILREGECCCTVIITLLLQVPEHGDHLCFSDSMCFLSFTDEISRSCVTLSMSIIKWF